MAKKTAISAALAACILVAGCGGDGGSAPPPSTGGGSSGGGGGGGTPTPPPVTYTRFADLTGVQTFATTCAGSELSGPNRIAVGGIPFGSGITIESDRSGPSYNVSTDGTGLTSTFSTSFTQADRDTTRSGELYRKTNANGFTELMSVFEPFASASDSEYIRVSQILAGLPNGLTNQLCAFGLPTVLTDLPASTLNYTQGRLYGTLEVVQNLGAGPSSTYRIDQSIISATANPVNGQITFTLELKGQEIMPGGQVSSTIEDFGTFTGQTTIDGTVQGYSDIFLNSNNFVVGNFGGWFFGPQGATAAISMSIQDRRSDNSDLILGSLAILRE